MNIVSSQSSRSLFQGVVAHRGAREKAPENTVAAFRQALDDGADAVELDVQVSRDGHFVVVHDSTLERTTNGKGRVDEHTLQELKALDAGSWFSEEFTGTKIPTLAESLAWAKGKTKIDIEVKTDVAERIQPRELMKVIEESGMAESVAVTSFHQPFIEKFEQEYPELETGVLFSSKPTIKKTVWGAAAGLVAGAAAGLFAQGSLGGAVGCGLIGAASGAGVGYLHGTHKLRSDMAKSSVDAVIPQWMVADRWVVGAAKKQGKSVSSYTVNNTTIEKLLRWRGVDGVITDRPQEFAATSGQAT